MGKKLEITIRYSPRCFGSGFKRKLVNVEGLEEQVIKVNKKNLISAEKNLSIYDGLNYLSFKEISHKKQKVIQFNVDLLRWYNTREIDIVKKYKQINY